MNITSFDNVRLGSKWPATIDVRRITGHEEQGVLAEVYLNNSIEPEHFAQLRKHKRDAVVALFSFRYKETESECMPDFWKDSIIIWDSRHPE